MSRLFSRYSAGQHSACSESVQPRIQTALSERKRTGEGVRGIAKRFGVDPSTVQRISRPFVGEAA